MAKALVVVDMQNDFIHGALGTPEARAIIPKVVEKVQKALESNVDVFYTLDTHGEDYINTQEGKNLPVPHCIRGTEGWELIKELSELPFASTFEKHAFGSPGLANYLYDSMYYEVEFIGVCTDICVLSNAILLKSIDPEVKIKVDSSCCAGVTPEKHEAALEAMRSCQIEVI